MFEIGLAQIPADPYGNKTGKETLAEQRNSFKKRDNDDKESQGF